MKLRHVDRPSGRIHSAGARRSWEERSETFWGLLSDTSSDAAVERSLCVVRDGLHVVAVVYLLKGELRRELLYRGVS